MWPKGKPRSAETKAKIKAWSMEHREQLRRPMTDEQRAKLAAAHNSEANKARLRAIGEQRKGKSRAWGTSDETREKLRAAWVIRKQEGRSNKGRPRIVQAAVTSESITLELPQFNGCTPTHTAEVYGVSSVYAIINSVTGKLYIGSANDTGQRWAKHRHELTLGKHHSPILQNSWNKYSPEVFVFRLLELVPSDRDSLLAAEQRWIDHYHTADRRYGYNARPLAHCPLVTGEHNSHAKLTESQVLVIRQRYDRGDSRPALAREYGVNTVTIYDIGRRKTWKHLDLVE